MEDYATIEIVMKCGSEKLDAHKGATEVELDAKMKEIET